jgi:hypothetical protein
MKTSVSLLKTAGIVNLFFFLFHIPFYWMFKWGENLSVLDINSRNILLTFNVISICLLFYFTFILLRYTRLILDSVLGSMLLILISVFYAVRIGAEFYLWGFRGFSSAIIVVLCAIPVACCLIPFFLKNQNN